MSDMQTLVDEREITRGLGRFARILDQKRWADLADGIDALRRQMRRFLDMCGGTQHLLGSILIDVDGDAAVSRCYVQARHQRRDDPAGPIFDSTGEYIDRWERRPQGWRIARRDAVWFLHTGDPAILAASQEDLG